MKIIKSTLLFTALTIANAPAHAGLWDTISGFFGGTDSGSEVAAPVEVAPAAQDTSLISTGVSLIPLLTQSLGITDGQASGGMGALLQAVQLLMPQSDFSSITQAIPDASSLISAAPSVDSSSGGGLMDTAMQMAGEQSTTVKAGLDLVSQFQSLGMGADMIPQFSGVAESYVTQNSSPETGSLLSTALSSLL